MPLSEIDFSQCSIGRILYDRDVMENLVSTAWLAGHPDDADLVVLDCSVHTETDGDGIRNTSGLGEFLAGHVPLAGFGNLTGRLSDRSGPIEFIPPSPNAFYKPMGELGVGDDTRGVLYDDCHTGWAARVWWMLRWVGFDRAALLDGGLGAWMAEGRPLSSDPPAIARPHVLTARPRPDLIAVRADVMAAIDEPGVTLVDALPSEFFNGQATIYARPGHIPTAINIPALGMPGDQRPDRSYRVIEVWAFALAFHVVSHLFGAVRPEARKASQYFKGSADE